MKRRHKWVGTMLTTNTRRSMTGISFHATNFTNGRTLNRSSKKNFLHFLIPRLTRRFRVVVPVCPRRTPVRHFGIVWETGWVWDRISRIGSQEKVFSLLVTIILAVCVNAALIANGVWREQKTWAVLGNIAKKIRMWRGWGILKTKGCDESALSTADTGILIRT